MPNSLFSSVNSRKKPDRLNVAIKSIDIAKDIDEVPFFEKKSTILSNLIMPEKQIDLAYGTALYVSQGGNNNGFYFTKHLLLANYKTILLKPLNVAHNPEFIIGVIYDAALSKKGDVEDPEPKFSLIEDSRIKFDEGKGVYVDGYSGEIDVWTHFVLFKSIYPGVVDVLKSNVSGNIETDDYFISMEIFYDEYKYLFNEDESTAFEKTFKNSYMDEYIGKTFEGKKLYKMYMGPITFGGGGIVGTPANVRSVLADVANKDVAQSNLSVNHDGDLYKLCSLSKDEMGQKGEERTKGDNLLNQNSNKEEIDMADIDIAKITQDVEKNVLERVKAIQAEGQLDEAQATIKAQREEIASMTKNLQDVSAASDQAIEDAEKALEEANQQLDEANNKITEHENKIKELEANQMSEDDKKELAEHKKLKKGKERMEDLSKRNINIPDGKKDEVLDKLGTFNDDQYEAYASALEMAGVKSDGDPKEDKDKAGKDDKDQQAGKDTASQQDKGASGSDKDVEKTLSDASGSPDTGSQDTASTEKRGNYMKALASLTTRTKDHPRGARA